MPHKIFLDAFSKDLAETSVLYLDSLYIECQQNIRMGMPSEGLEPTGLLLKSKISLLWEMAYIYMFRTLVFTSVPDI